MRFRDTTGTRVSAHSILYPVVVYICSSDNLVESSLCILSEDLNHDVAFAYKVIKETVDFIKKELNPSVKTIHCFHLQLVPIKKLWLSHSILILTVCQINLFLDVKGYKDKYIFK